MSKGSPIRQVRIDDKRWAKMKQAAANEGAERGETYPISQLIRDAIDAYMEKRDE